MFRTRQFRVVVVAVGVVAVAGIASLGYASNADESPPAEQATAVGQAADSTPASPEPDMSDYQKAILADGEITDVEMEAAVRDTVVCLRTQGWNAQFLAKTAHWAPLSFMIVSSQEGATIAASTVSCKDLYLSELGTPYALSRGPKDGVFGPEEHTRRIEACIAENGFPLDGRYVNTRTARPNSPPRPAAAQRGTPA